MWAVGELGLPHERIDVGGRGSAAWTPRNMAAEPQSPDSDRRRRGRGGLGIQRLRALPGGALRRRSAVAGERAAAGAGRHVDGLAGLDALARYDRDVLGPDRTPEAERDYPAIEAAARRLGATWQILDEHLATRRYVAGDTLTIGDVPVGASCYRYFGLPIERPALPHLERGTRA